MFFARLPGNPKDPNAWNYIPIFKYYVDGQMEQRGTYPRLKSVSDLEGLSKADIDGDGLQDIVGGGYWFKDIRNDAFSTVW